MSVQFSTAVRNAMLDAYESTIGPSAVLKLFSGPLGSNCAAADPSGLLVTISFPVDWMTAASNGVKTLSAAGNTASASGTAASYRWYNSAQTVCHEQGIVSVTGGGGDLILDNVAIVSGNLISISSRQLYAGNP